MADRISRRRMLGTTAVASCAALSTPLVADRTKGDERKSADKATWSFHFCLNTSSIRNQGKNLPVEKQIDVAAEAGYDALELWMGDLHKYAAAGGSLDDLRKRISDGGLTVESAIGFARWIVDEDSERAKGLEAAKKDMDVLAKIGAKRIAAPPAGAKGPIDLRTIAERYRALLEVGDQTGVVPQVECWGTSPTISRLSQIAFIAIESGHPKACMLPDVYHLFRGGSDFDGLKLLDGRAIKVFHMNDYPDSPPREQMNDSHRVYPGDGVAPLGQILGDLQLSGFDGYLSLELFNRDYWQQEPLQVAKTGLEKMRRSVESAATRK